MMGEHAWIGTMAITSSILSEVPLQSRSRSSISFLLWLHIVQRDMESKSLTSGVRCNTTIRVGFSDKLLPASIHQQTNQIRAHVMSGEVSQRLGEMRLVQINLWGVSICPQKIIWQNVHRQIATRRSPCRAWPRVCRLACRSLHDRCMSTGQFPARRPQAC